MVSRQEEELKLIFRECLEYRPQRGNAYTTWVWIILINDSRKTENAHFSLNADQADIGACILHNTSIVNTLVSSVIWLCIRFGSKNKLCSNKITYWLKEEDSIWTKVYSSPIKEKSVFLTSIPRVSKKAKIEILQMFFKVQVY